MRALVFAFLALTLPLASCYNPGPLGEEPFRCTYDRPECPEFYICATELGMVGKLKNCPSKTNCVCVCDTENSPVDKCP